MDALFKKISELEASSREARSSELAARKTVQTLQEQLEEGEPLAEVGKGTHGRARARFRAPFHAAPHPRPATRCSQGLDGLGQQQRG